MNSISKKMLGEVVVFINGDRGVNYPKTKDYVQQGIPFFNASDLDGITVNLSNAKFISDEAYESLRNGKINEGDILFCLRGSLGNIGLVKNIKKGAIASSLVIIRPTKEIEKDYLYYILSGPINRKIVRELDNGSVQGNLSVSELKKVEINLPNLENQKAIAHILRSLDKKIILNKKINENLEEIAKAIFKSWFIDFDPVRAKAEGHSTGLRDEISDLFPDSFEDSEIGKIPRGWFCSKFSKFMMQKKEKIGQRKATILSALNSGDLVPSDKYFKKKVYSKDTAKYIAIDKYDIAYNPSRINIGSIGIHCDDYLGAVSPIYSVVTPNPGWHWYALMSIKRDYFNKNVQILASGSVRQSLSIDDFLSISVVTPPDASPLICYFNKVFDLFLKKQNNLNEERRCLENISKTILPKLISGELRITDAEEMIDVVGI